MCVCFSPVFLSILLVGTALWWWQGQFRVPRPLDQSFSLKESQDPLLLGEPPIEPNTCLRKARKHTHINTLDFNSYPKKTIVVLPVDEIDIKNS